MKTKMILCGLLAALAAGDANAQTSRYRGRRFARGPGRAFSRVRIGYRRPPQQASRYRGPIAYRRTQIGIARSRARTMLRRNARSPVGSPLLRRSPYLRYYRGHNLRTTRGIDPHGAIVLQGGGSGGKYATQATQANQATQATQAQQYIQPAFRRPPFRFRRR